MEWKRYYLDAMLVPLGFMINIGYHVWLWHKLRTQPFITTIGINSHARRFWVPSILKDIEKKNILAVQSLRNLIMGSTLMATTSILLSAGLAAVISSTYSVKNPLNDIVYSSSDSENTELLVSLKFVTLLTFFLFSFFCHTLSIRFVSQLSVLIICTPQEVATTATTSYLSGVLEKGIVLNTVGNRVFYSALPLLLWIFGPVFVLLGFLVILPVLYSLDFPSGISSHNHGKHKVSIMEMNNDEHREEEDCV